LTTPDLFRLDGKVALVTGGSRGIGQYIAEGLREMGARVVITARKAPELDSARRQLAGLGVDVCSIVNDISDSESITPLVSEILDRFGAIDILVNNAGTSWIAPAADYPDSGWQKVMAVCIDGPFRLCREVGRRVMIPNRSGKILNIGSTAGSQGNGSGRPGGGHFVGYHAAKGAMVSFTRALAVEWGALNINVNCLSPGFISTEAAAPFQEEVRDQTIPLTPLGRYGGGPDIKAVAAFLVSDAAAYITGQVLTVDGGLSAN